MRPRPGLAPAALTPELPATCPPPGEPLRSGRLSSAQWEGGGGAMGCGLGKEGSEPSSCPGAAAGGGQGAGAGYSPSPGLGWGREGAGPFCPGQAACPAVCPAHLSCHLPPPLLPFLELGRDRAAVTRHPSKVFLLPRLLPTWEARVMDPVLVTLNLLLFPRRTPEGP